jgi:thiamine kinase-like enzyme
MTEAREALLSRVLDEVAKHHDYKIHQLKVKGLPPTGANFTSQLFHASITAPNKQDIDVFAKVSVVGQELRNAMPLHIFEVENHVYTKLSKIYDEIENENNIPKEHKLFMPKYYGGSEIYLEEVLVLQDLSVDGFTTFNRLKSIDWEYASKSVEELAKLHALSFAYQEKYPDDFEEAVKILRREIPAGDSMLMGMIQHLIAKVMGTVNENNRERVEKFVANNMMKDKFAMYYKPLKKPVLVHGDFRMSNLMHKVDQVLILLLLYVAVTGLDSGSLCCAQSDCVENYKEK